MDRATSALFERGTVHNMDAEVRKIVMEAAIVAIAGFSLAPEVIAKIAGLATTVQNGLFAAPIDLPGTKLNKARAARPAYLALWADLARARFGVDPATGCLLSPSAESLVPAGALDPTHGLFHEFAEMGDAATPEKIADRLAQNAVGASETTGNTLLGFYIAISRTPGLMARLRVEQAEVMARLGAESLSYDALLNKMPLLEAALKESQRVLPVSHTIFRRALVDVEVGGFKIKKGQMMLIPPGTFQLLQAHTWDGKTAPPGALPRSYDQRQWEEAYKPERWLVPAAEQPNLHVFGYGPRKCVGMTVANLELRSAMALTLRRGTWVMNNAAVHVKFMPMLSLASGPTSITFTKDPLPGAV
ncbi:hypothetical protein FOA52_001375 [Chlamydomonas sp. UWO 241]|nr:hypothetical protein FOA52_001375 [Chlamydomonas sp. UWO 241]